MKRQQKKAECSHAFLSLSQVELWCAVDIQNQWGGGDLWWPGEDCSADG